MSLPLEEVDPSIACCPHMCKLPLLVPRASSLKFSLSNPCDISYNHPTRAMAKIHRECREKSLPAIRLTLVVWQESSASFFPISRKPVDFFSDISDWTTSKRYYVKNRDIVRENIRTIKSGPPRLPAVRKVAQPQRVTSEVCVPGTSILSAVLSAEHKCRATSNDCSEPFQKCWFECFWWLQSVQSTVFKRRPSRQNHPFWRSWREVCTSSFWKVKSVVCRPRELQWAKDPSQMKTETVCTLIAKFATGMSLLDHVGLFNRASKTLAFQPFRFVAETGITDLLIALRNHQSLISVLPQLVRGIRAGLYSFDVEKKKFCLKTLSRITSMQGIGPQLVPFYRQLLPPLSLFSPLHRSLWSFFRNSASVEKPFGSRALRKRSADRRDHNINSERHGTNGRSERTHQHQISPSSLWIVSVSLNLGHHFLFVNRARLINIKVLVQRLWERI